MKVVSRNYNVTRPSDRKTMRSRLLQRCCHRVRIAGEQQRSHCIDRIQSHASRSTGSEDAIGQLFPESRVGTFAPNLFKITQPLPNLFASCSVGGHHSFNCDGFLIALHGSLSTARFYEPAGIIVNEFGLCGVSRFNHKDTKTLCTVIHFVTLCLSGENVLHKDPELGYDVRRLCP